MGLLGSDGDGSFDPWMGIVVDHSDVIESELVDLANIWIEPEFR